MCAWVGGRGGEEAISLFTNISESHLSGTRAELRGLEVPRTGVQPTDTQEDPQVKDF